MHRRIFNIFFNFDRWYVINPFHNFRNNCRVFIRLNINIKSFLGTFRWLAKDLVTSTKTWESRPNMLLNYLNNIVVEKFSTHEYSHSKQGSLPLSRFQASIFLEIVSNKSLAYFWVILVKLPSEELSRMFLRGWGNLT
jgi:hypothetical protein